MRQSIALLFFLIALALAESCTKTIVKTKWKVKTRVLPQETATKTVTVTADPTTSQCTQPTLADPGFERDDSLSWDLTFNCTAGTSLGYESSPAPHSGGRYLLSVFQSSIGGHPGLGGTGLSSSFHVCAGRRYQFSAWTNNFNLGAYAGFSIGTETLAQSPMLPDTNVWIQTTGTWVAPATAEVRIKVWFLYSRSLIVRGPDVTRMGVDDVTITLIE